MKREIERMRELAEREESWERGLKKWRKNEKS